MGLSSTVHFRLAPLLGACQARRPESVAVAPSNVAVMRGHLPCAAAERPLESEDGRSHSEVDNRNSYLLNKFK